MKKMSAAGVRLCRFGEVVTCDHLVAEAAHNNSIEGHGYAVLFYDLYSEFVGCYPTLTKTGIEALHALQHFRGRQGIDFVYSDGSGELAVACRLDHTLHQESQSGDKQSNGIAERQVQEAKLGTATNLAQAGITHPYWSYAMRHWMMAWNITKKRGKDTPWELRNSEPFPGKIVPFGALVRLHPSRGNKGRTAQPFADKTVEGVFMGYYLESGHR